MLSLYVGREEKRFLSSSYFPIPPPTRELERKPLSIRIDRKDANFDTKKRRGSEKRLPTLFFKNTSSRWKRAFFVPKRVDTT
jgi:hypothetical protein